MKKDCRKSSGTLEMSSDLDSELKMLDMEMSNNQCDMNVKTQGEWSGLENQYLQTYLQGKTKWMHYSLPRSTYSSGSLSNPGNTRLWVGSGKESQAERSRNWKQNQARVASWNAREFQGWNS